MKKICLGLLAAVLLTTLILAGCTTTTSHNDSSHFFGVASYNRDDGRVYIIGDAQVNGHSTGNAYVTVNNIKLNYGLPLDSGNTELGNLKLYYGDIHGEPGQQLEVKASYAGSLFFQETVTIPGDFEITEPADPYLPPANITLVWTPSANANMYLSTYENFFQGKIYFTNTKNITAIIPGTELVLGEAGLYVDALNGKNLDDLFEGSSEPTDGDNDEDTDDYDILDQSYWIAANSSEKDVEIRENAIAADANAPEVKYETDNRAVVNLQILKEERVTIKGIKFTRRIYNAEQITQPGNALIDIKLIKNHLSIAAVDVLDHEEKNYYSWNKTRKYKSKSKTYSHNISLKPYSTVVIHTKTADINRADYKY